MRGLVAKSRNAEPTVWIGKEGATGALLSQIENQLKTRELIKVKNQKSALQVVSTDELAKKVAASTGSTLVEVMGHTFTLYKRREILDVRKKSAVTGKIR